MRSYRLPAHRATTSSAPQLGDAWYATGGNWRIDNGELVIDHAYNHPLWLRKPIPADAVIELDCWSNDDVGDLKIEAWGDGKSFAKEASYTATSYVFIFGGWHNQLGVIARMNEHGQDRRARADLHVEKGRKYHWRIARLGGHIDWQIDGKTLSHIRRSEPARGQRAPLLRLQRLGGRAALRQPEDHAAVEPLAATSRRGRGWCLWRLRARLRFAD